MSSDDVDVITTTLRVIRLRPSRRKDGSGWLERALDGALKLRDVGDEIDIESLSVKISFDPIGWKGREGRGGRRADSRWRWRRIAPSSRRSRGRGSGRGSVDNRRG